MQNNSDQGFGNNSGPPNPNSGPNSNQGGGFMNWMGNSGSSHNAGAPGDHAPPPPINKVSSKQPIISK